MNQLHHVSNTHTFAGRQGPSGGLSLRKSSLLRRWGRGASRVGSSRGRPCRRVAGGGSSLEGVLWGEGGRGGGRRQSWRGTLGGRLDPAESAMLLVPGDAQSSRVADVFLDVYVGYSGGLQACPVSLQSLFLALSQSKVVCLELLA